MEYKEINTEKDIENLMETYGWFHDSCILSMSYETGNCVDEDFAMSRGESDEHRLKLIIRRQGTPTNIEMLFVGVRKFHVGGYTENYFCDIFEACLYFDYKLIEGKKLIVWTNGIEIEKASSPYSREDESNNGTYIIADKLLFCISD